MNFINKIEISSDYKSFAYDMSTIVITTNPAKLASTISNEMLHKGSVGYVIEGIAHDIAAKVKEEVTKALQEKFDQISQPQGMSFQGISYQGMWTDEHASFSPSVKKTDASNEVYKMFQEHLPQLENVKVKCPKCTATDTVLGTIVHLNDNHGIERESIADWLESLDIDMVFKNYEPNPKES